MSKTIPLDWIGKPFEGYVMNTLFSEDSTSQIMPLIHNIKAKYGDAVHCMDSDSLHITLLDWIAPLVDYDGQDKKELFSSIYKDYNNALEDILSNEQPFDVVFDTIHVAPTTIFISGHDNGAFERIRSKYLEKIELLPNTKRPPNIIHSSLARFTKELDLAELESFMASQSISFTQNIENFRLVHTLKEPMLEFEILKTYSLQPASTE